jgi:hypothetical protein
VVVALVVSLISLIVEDVAVSVLVVTVGLVDERVLKVLVRVVE